MEKVGAKREPASEKVLRAASELFYREGIRGVGVEAVAARAGVTKKTLYDNFGSKDALISAYLRGRDECWRAWVLEVAERGGNSPEEKLLSTFDALEEWVARQEKVRGCGFVNAAAEIADAGHPAREVIREQKEWMRQYLADLARDAGLRKPNRLAERLMILHEGASVMNGLDLSRNATRKAKDIATLLVETSRPEGDGD